jgi:hypothetical protein
MRFLSLFTADRLVPPSDERIAEMTAYVKAQKAAGRLIATGGLKSRVADGFVVRAKEGSFNVIDVGALWSAATGYAILEAPSREAAIADAKDFLSIMGQDGVCELIGISNGPSDE